MFKKLFCLLCLTTALLCGTIHATLILVVRGDTTTVIAADSRLTDGNGVIVSDDQVKLRQVGSGVAVAFAGQEKLPISNSEKKKVIELIEIYCSTNQIDSGEYIPPDSVAVGLRQFLEQSCHKLGLKMFDSQMHTSILVCGFDSNKDQKTYIVQPKFTDSSMQEKRWCIDEEPKTETNRIVCMGERNTFNRLLDSLELDQSNIRHWSLLEMIEFAKQSIRSVEMIQNLSGDTRSVGGPIDIVSISPRNKLQWISKKSR